MFVCATKYFRFVHFWCEMVQVCMPMAVPLNILYAVSILQWARERVPETTRKGAELRDL